MKITLEEVSRVAHLAHLRFSDAELDRLRGQLDQILAYIDKLNELKTEGVEPATGGAIGLVPPMREDRPGPTLSPEEALANAPESGRGHFKVPRVIG
ncbi:MAG TPA: Asp-tRNA(Asn)/Glu-tRNA(Gln) amidotransferase subunit GatC [Patescibacteria group bacterium]|nr:Asp-tRNA(Asn)/Glu-tRNA(Gln) amidotransferase subunit GatC [Patescibacteria group bacterium]